MPHLPQISRRAALQSTAAAAALAITAQGQDEPAKGILIVDTHTHFYDPKRKGGVPWPGKDDSLLYRPMLPAQFVKLTKPLGVAATVVIEASPLVEDNEWLLDLAVRESVIWGIIGNLKPGEPGFRDHLVRFAGDHYRGIRVNVGDLKKGLGERKYLLDLQNFSERGLTLDVNGGPDTPAVVAKLAKEIPDLTICINHCGNLRIDGKQPPADWLAGMKAAAEHKNVFCKVSALVEGTGKREGDAPRDVEFYEPVLLALWKTWGEERLIYGSNWPVCLRSAPYETVLGIVRDYFAQWPRRIQEKFFSGNAKKAYRWSDYRKVR